MTKVCCWPRCSGHAAKNVSLAWLVLTPDFVAYAGMWVLFAVMLVAVYGPTDLACQPVSGRRCEPWVRTG